MERSGHGYATVSENTLEERKKIQPSNAVPAKRSTVPAPPKAPEQVISPLFLLNCCCARGPFSLVIRHPVVMPVSVMNCYYFWQ